MKNSPSMGTPLLQLIRLWDKGIPQEIPKLQATTFG